MNVTRRENEKCQAKILGHATRLAALPLSLPRTLMCVFMQRKTCILEKNQKIETRNWVSMSHAVPLPPIPIPIPIRAASLAKNSG